MEIIMGYISGYIASPQALPLIGVERWMVVTITPPPPTPKSLYSILSPRCHADGNWLPGRAMDFKVPPAIADMTRSTCVTVEA